MMRGRVVLVTGATSGIGKVTAVELARRGATVGVVARDRERGESAVAEVRQAGGEGHLFLADLGSLDAVRSLADAVLERFPRLHVLLNNAGAWHTRRSVTPDGLETTFAVNHLAHFLLTNLLLDRLKGSAPARVVNVSSGAHRMGGMNLEDPGLERRYSGSLAYAQSKLANILFTYELARRLEGTEVTANALHPGFVRTGFGRQDGNGALRWIFRLLAPFALSAEEGARTSIHLCSSPEVEGASGGYYERCRLASSSAPSQDRVLQGRLWDLSSRMAGLPA